MSRERKIEVLSGIMSRRAYDAAQQKFGYIANELVEQHKELGVAGGTNDFHDNAAFDEANRKIDVTGILFEQWRQAVMCPTFIERRKETDTAQIGNLVHVEIMTYGEQFRANILGSADAILFQNDSISYESPLGKALLGHVKGAEVEYEAANRKLRAKIIDIFPGDF